MGDGRCCIDARELPQGPLSFLSSLLSPPSFPRWRVFCCGCEAMAAARAGGRGPLLLLVFPILCSAPPGGHLESFGCRPHGTLQHLTPPTAGVGERAPVCAPGPAARRAGAEHQTSLRRTPRLARFFMRIAFTFTRYTYRHSPPHSRALARLGKGSREGAVHLVHFAENPDAWREHGLRQSCRTRRTNPLCCTARYHTSTQNSCRISCGALTPMPYCTVPHKR